MIRSSSDCSLAGKSIGFSWRPVWSVIPFATAPFQGRIVVEKFLFKALARDGEI